MVRRFNELKTGDTFAWKIETDEYPDFKGRYIILTYYYNEDFEKRSCKLFRLKITKDKKLPVNEEEVNNLEDIKLCHNIYELAIKEYEEAKSAIPDEYGYIYQYTLNMYIDRKTLPKKLNYIGNFQLKPIPNEFYSKTRTRNQAGACWEYFDENILRPYVQYNLKQFMGYTKEGNKRIYDHEVDAENFRMYLKKLGDAIEGPNGKEVLKALGIDIDQEIKEGKHLKDSLTYVGPKEEKNIKKKKS